jgi:hypothetical protein
LLRNTLPINAAVAFFMMVRFSMIRPHPRFSSLISAA